jgi:hypothetical protein
MTVLAATVRDNPAAHRYELLFGDEVVGELLYRANGRVVTWRSALCGSRRRLVASSVPERSTSNGSSHSASAAAPFHSFTPRMRQHRLLGAADALEKRARAIHDWPIDEGILARVITIATSVIGITIARLILDPLGL